MPPYPNVYIKLMLSAMDYENLRSPSPMEAGVRIDTRVLNFLPL